MGEKTVIVASLQVTYIEKLLIKGNSSFSKFIVTNVTPLINSSIVIV